MPRRFWGYKTGPSFGSNKEGGKRRSKGVVAQKSSPWDRALGSSSSVPSHRPTPTTQRREKPPPTYSQGPPASLPWKVCTAAMVGHVNRRQATWLCPEPAGLRDWLLGTTSSLSEPQGSWLQSFPENTGQGLSRTASGPATSLGTREHLPNDARDYTSCSTAGVAQGPVWEGHGDSREWDSLWKGRGRPVCLARVNAEA